MEKQESTPSNPPPPNPNHLSLNQIAKPGNRRARSRVSSPAGGERGAGSPKVLSHPFLSPGPNPLERETSAVSGERRKPQCTHGSSRNACGRRPGSSQQGRSSKGRRGSNAAPWSVSGIGSVYLWGAGSSYAMPRALSVDLAARFQAHDGCEVRFCGGVLVCRE